MTSSIQSMRRGVSKLVILSACVVIILAGCLCFWLWVRAQHLPPEQALIQARRALAQGHYAEAEQLISHIPASFARFPDAMLIAGEAATRDNRLAAAAEYYASVEGLDSEKHLLARFSLAEVLLHAGRFTEADRAYRDVIEKDPRQWDALSRLSWLCGVTGRRRSSGEMLFRLLRNGRATLDELILFADLERPAMEREFLAEAADQQPNDGLIQHGIASQHMADGRAPEAIEILESLTAADPLFEEAQCALGELAGEISSARFEQWHQQLPEEAEEWPDVWFVRGRQAAKVEQLQMAARCFTKTLETVPLHRRANNELGIVLQKLKHPLAAEFSNRGRQLTTLSSSLTQVRESNGSDIKSLKSLFRILEDQQRYWELCTWALLAQQKHGAQDWITEPLESYSDQLADMKVRLPETQLIATGLDVESYPLFNIADVSKEQSAVAGTTSSQIHFEVADCGIEFVYFNGNDDSTPGARIQEQTGGGVSVLDIEADGIPDLYLVQAGIWPAGAAASKPDPDYSDRLFRNNQGTGFTDVTDVAGIHELGFGQCCAIGDVNEDGFDDLYVATVGQNSLLISNGDGTFTKAADDAMHDAAIFSSTCLIADLNSDGVQDLFNAEYVTGPDVYNLICNGQACSPANFDGLPDTVHLGIGDGSFRSLRVQTPIEESKGLGALALRTQGAALPSIFVANDQTPNFFLQQIDSAAGPEIIDTGLTTGLALNLDGISTAAMGIAADDVDHNGLTDFFVTNFSEEANCLYLQNSPGSFTDGVRAAGLHTAGFSYVGWGSQFVDADLNGESDLIVTNGHVESYYVEEETKMPSQFFHNMGAAQFELMDPAVVGEYFSRKYFGRALAKLDWNLDGLMDVAMVPTRDPAVVVTNTTKTDCSFLNIRLVAASSVRDAFFSTVTVTTNEKSWTKQLLAGGGFHAANQRILQFGLGETDAAALLVVTWPSGAVTQITQPPVNSTLVVVEGHPTATVISESGLSTIDTAPSPAATQTD